MKSILSASLCTAVLAFAVPALAQTDTTKPMHHHRHHSSRMDHMQGPKTHSKRAGDPSTDELNAKSLAAARGGNASATGDSTAPASMPSSSTAPAGMPSSSTAPGTGMAAPSSMPPAGSAPSSGSTGTTTPSNTPGGQ